jgi:hypothetical protein
VARRLLIIILAMGLAACAAVRSHLAFWRHRSPSAVASAGPTPALVAPRTARVPRPADGLWAILDPGCSKPALADPRVWPKCASPFWINRDSAVVVRSRAGLHGKTPDGSYRTDYRIAAGNPVIAQVGNAKDGYLFLALTELSQDGDGHFTEATGAAFACDQPHSGAISLKPNVNGCEGQPPDAIRKVAWATLQNPATLARVAWIAPGAP